MLPHVLRSRTFRCGPPAVGPDCISLCYLSSLVIFCRHPCSLLEFLLEFRFPDEAKRTITRSWLSS